MLRLQVYYYNLLHQIQNIGTLNFQLVQFKEKNTNKKINNWSISDDEKLNPHTPNFNYML